MWSDTYEFQPVQTEREMVDLYCRMLESEGIPYQREVKNACGRADIVTADTVYEVKLDLTRPVLFKAMGQVTMYAAALGKPRRVVIGRALDSDEFEQWRAVVRRTGVLLNVTP